MGLRRATAAADDSDGVNADFFDIQARALFHGHLDVPPGSLGIEAFVVDGRHYMYFGPFLALLRMPVLLVTDRLDGRLTALSMLVGWFVLAAAVTVLVRRVRRRLRGDAPVGRFEAVGLAAVVATVTGGSTVVYLAVAAVGVPRGLHLEHGADGGDGGQPDRGLGRPELAADHRHHGTGAGHDAHADHRRLGDGRWR